MKNKIILFLFLASYLGLASCSKGTKPTVSYISDLKEESRTQAKDGSYIYSHFLNVGVVKLYNERKIKHSEFVAELKLYHLSGFKKQFENAPAIKYRLFTGDSSEMVYPKRDSALMVSIGVSATITDMAGKKVVSVSDIPVLTKVGVAVMKNSNGSSDMNTECITANEHISQVITNEKNIYHENINLNILNNPSVFTKEQKYKLHFRVFDKLDTNRYFEGETVFKAY